MAGHTFLFFFKGEGGQNEIIPFLFYRKEMQKVLAEVTDHMEQQHSAHRYLEKLRMENEAIVLKEKDRAVRSCFILTGTRFNFNDASVIVHR